MNAAVPRDALILHFGGDQGARGFRGQQQLQPTPRGPCGDGALLFAKLRDDGLKRRLIVFGLSKERPLVFWYPGRGQGPSRLAAVVPAGPRHPQRRKIVGVGGGWGMAQDGPVQAEIADPFHAATGGQQTRIPVAGPPPNPAQPA